MYIKRIYMFDCKRDNDVIKVVVGNNQFKRLLTLDRHLIFANSIFYHWLAYENNESDSNLLYDSEVRPLMALNLV